MCIQHICPQCSTPFTSPFSILRCPVFLHHDPPLDRRALTCPNNKWTKAPHPNGLHPGAQKCPHRLGPSSYPADNKKSTKSNNRGRPTGNKTRQLAPKPGVKRLPHEGSDLYVRPGDLFKPGVWQKVDAALRKAYAEKERQVREQDAQEARQMREQDAQRARQMKEQDAQEARQMREQDTQGARQMTEQDEMLAQSILAIGHEMARKHNESNRGEERHGEDGYGGEGHGEEEEQEEQGGREVGRGWKDNDLVAAQWRRD